MWPRLVDLDAQLELAVASGVALKVVCAPLAGQLPADGIPAAQLPRRLNEAFAEAIRERGPVLSALATVDAYSGDAGADEARFAVDELGLPGIVVDVSQGERLLSAPEAGPTLAFAAERGFPVFAHPVGPPVLPPRYAEQGFAGIVLSRGTEAALTTLALLAAGVLEELPGLQLVVAGIGGAALALAGLFDDGPSAARSRLHVDTMGFDLPTARLALDVVGPERLLVGADWPAIPREASRERVGMLLDGLDLDGPGRALVAGGNARRLLGL
jgi:predicted TIM-barrel fold metal-dependent hydrolase